jgi:hypothetical protein
MKLELSSQIFETAQISSFITIRSMAAELFQADGRTHTTKPKVAFVNFAKASKNGQSEIISFRTQNFKHQTTDTHYSVGITRWFKYDRDYLCVNKSPLVPVIFEPPSIMPHSELNLQA